jgi:hypothetical protein
MTGFVANSMPTMARVPGLLAAFQGLGATLGPKEDVTWHVAGDHLMRVRPTDVPACSRGLQR